MKTIGWKTLARSASAMLLVGMGFTSLGVANAATIAITEFIIDPHGTDTDAPEWIELFNYGTTPVDIGGWTIKDNSSAAFTFPAGFTIASGDYAVSAINRQNFINRWLGGVDDARVVAPGQAFQLNNSAPGDGLYLRDASGNLVWSLGYNISATEPVSQYRATYLAVNDFSVTNYGVPPQDGAALINRNGADGTGTLGYEDNNRTADPKMYSSLAGDGTQEWGSPLRGNYSVVVPEPGALALVLGAAFGFVSVRRGK